VLGEIYIDTTPAKSICHSESFSSATDALSIVAAFARSKESGKGAAAIVPSSFVVRSPRPMHHPYAMHWPFQ
jgi:hypothetical protein